MSNYFEGKVVIVTGALRGVGEATVRKYLEKGANVMMIDLDDLSEAKAKLAEEFGADRVEAVNMNFCDNDACIAMAKQTMDKWGRIDAVANVAGTLHTAQATKDFDLDEWDRVFNVNVKGPMQICKAVLPYMEEAKSGSIVNVGSWWGHRGYAFFGAYCASKAALIKFTQALAEEMAEFGGRANVLCPGNVNTRLHKKALEDEAAARGITFEEMKKIFWDAIPLKSAADPAWIADGIVYLTSDQATYVTGETLNVNGGCDIR